jgi:hypothetical protein
LARNTQRHAARAARCPSTVPMLRGTHDHHRNVRAPASAPRTTALHAANRETFAVTRHGLPEVPAVAPSLRPTIEFAPSVVSDASKPPLAIPNANAIRCSDDSDRSHHVPRFPLPVVTSPGSAENRNTHRPSSAARGFVPRRLSDAHRRPSAEDRFDALAVAADDDCAR